MDKIKNKALLCFIVMFVFLSVSSAYADYKSDIAQGNAAYKSGDLQAALKYYMDADVENPSSQLEAAISNIEKKFDKSKNSEQFQVPAPLPSAPVSPTMSQRPVNSTSSGFAPLLLGLDTALTAVAIYAYFDYNGAADYYETLYSIDNDAAGDNYTLLEAQKRYVEVKGNLASTTAILAGVMLAYTICDFSFIHSAFPLQVAYNPADKKISLAYSINY